MESAKRVLLKLSGEWFAGKKEKGFDEKNGARPLNRMIQKYIEDLIAKNLVSNKIKTGDKLLVDYKSNSKELNLLINKKEKAS
mgnify:CR=1 FL=1